MLYLMRSILSSSFFFFNDTATTEIYTLSLHDALPIFLRGGNASLGRSGERHSRLHRRAVDADQRHRAAERRWSLERSEEHTSELQSPCNLVCRLLLEKKKKKISPALCSSR